MIRGNRKLARAVLQFEAQSQDALSESMDHFVSYGLLGKRYTEKHNEMGVSHRFREIPMMIHELFNIPEEIEGMESLGQEVYRNIQDSIDESMCGKQSNWFPYFGDNKRRDTKQFIEHDWGKGLEKVGVSNFTSQLATKADYMFHALDMLNDVRFISMGLRHYDGYPLLSILGDIRNKNKDSRPQVPVEVIEELLEVFVWSIEGLIGQLKVCLELAGCQAASDRITLKNIKVKLPLNFVRPKTKEVAAVLKVIDAESALEVFGLGIPGKNTSNAHCYHVNDSTRRYEGSDDLILKD